MNGLGGGFGPGVDASIQRVRGGVFSIRDHEVAVLVGERLLTLSTFRLVFGRRLEVLRGPTKSSLGVRVRRRRDGLLMISRGPNHDATPLELSTAIALAAAFGTRAFSVVDLPKLFAYSIAYIAGNA